MFQCFFLFFFPSIHANYWENKCNCQCYLYMSLWYFIIHYNNHSNFQIKYKTNQIKFCSIGTYSKTFKNILPYFYAVVYFQILHWFIKYLFFFFFKVCFNNNKKSFLLYLCFNANAETCRTALINLKSEHRRYNHRSDLFVTALNLTCCCQTLMILSLYYAENAGVQPSPTDGTHHKNLVLRFYMWARSEEHSATVCFPFALQSLDLICDKLPKWPPDCSL